MAETDKDEKKAETNGIKYKGRVTVEVRKGKKTISKKTYKNAGNQPLYYFLSRCIVSDDYRPELAPRYIRLFHRTNIDDVSAGIDGYSVPVSVAMYTNSGKVVDDPENPNYKNSAAYLHFTIPFSAIHQAEGVSGTNSITIYQAGLYDSTNIDDDEEGNYSARFNFTKTNESTGAEEWDPITVPTDRGDYSLFIEWTMSFENN